ncbi:MAG: RHS repeat-associated core domain-containing protein, partial [Acidobacteriota bacterium]
GERKVTTRYNPARGTFDYDITNSSFGPGHTFTLPPTDGPWVLTTFDQRQIQEGGETATSEFCFEADTGFLLRHRIRKNTGRSADDLLHVFSRNARGDLTRERYFGARDGGLSTGSLCTLALPTEDAYRVDHTYRSGVRQTSAFKDASGAGLGFLSLDLDIDWSTGLAAASRDSAGLETAYEYDILGRLEWIKPASGQLGWTQMSYSRATIAPSSPATVQVRRRGNGSEQAAVLAQTVRRFDEFGRPTLHEIALPDGSASGTWGVRETEYNPMGWVTSISERDDGAAAGRTRYLDFDAFGRPGRILLPDDHEVRIEYEGVRRVTRTESIGTARSSPGGQIVETDVSRSEIYDRLGRLVAVEEPSGPSGAAVTTAYSYDLLGHLTESQTTAATASQTRCYDYDWRGFALSTAHPEKGKISSGCDADDGRVFFSDHDALGNATRIVDGPNDLMLTFDRASRVTQIDETDGRPLKSMTYATGNSAGWSQGKLIRAKRHNYLEPAVPLDAVVTQRFTYGGRGGAIDHVRTEVSTGEAFEQSYSYNPLGQVATIDYPDCAPDHPFCDDGNLPAAPTVSYEYTDGFLTSIPGYANALAYHSNGRLRQVVHSNGVTDTVALDPDRMRRPASISTTGATCPTFGGCPWTSGSDGDWTSGEFVYDGTGSPVRIGDDWYLYDSVGRVVEGTALSAGPGRRQTYTYDAFGNVRSIRTEEGGSPVVQTLAVDARTNRLTDTLYDGAGNQTSYFTYKYSFDAFNQLSRFEGDGEDWVYLYDAAGLRLAAYQVLTGFTHWYLRAPGGKLLTYLIDNRSTATVQVFRLRDYIYRGSSLLATRVLGSTTRHTHVDQLRTPRLVTDADGRVYSYHAYFPYGRQATDENQVFEPVQFTGAERDSHGQPEDFDDLDYMRARHYHAHNARFLNVDPLKGDPLRPQSHNRYAYAQGNPMRFTDPTGLKAKDEAKCQDDEKGDGNGCETAAEPEPDPKGVFTDTIDVAGFSDPVDLVGRTLPDPPAGHGFYQRSFYPRALMHPFVVSLELAEKAVIGDGSIMRCARSRPPQTRDAHFLAGLLHYVYAGSSPAKVVKSGFIALGGVAAVTGGLVADTVSSPFRYLDGDLIAPSLGLPAGTDRPITGVAAVTAVEVLADQLIRPVFDENCARTSPNFTFMN